MAYQVGNGIWGSVFAVPTDIVDRHIRMSGPLSLKALLVLLRAGRPMETQELAGLLGQPRTDVQDAMNYWVEHGILSADGVLLPEKTGEQPAEAAKPAATLVYTEEPEETGEGRKLVKIGNTRPRLSTQEINEMAALDAAIENLLQETQQVLGKPLTPVITDMLVGLYSYYGMEPDLILMLVQYCVSIGKSNVRYIEKVAANWMEQGIDSHEKAEKEILRASQSMQMENKIKTCFGIYDRALISNEKKYIDTWVNVYQMDLELIRMAYERTVEMKGKLSFAYINGILTNWHQKNIKSPSQAEQEIRKSPNAKKEQPDQQASYDIGELENMIAHGNLLK